MVRPIYQLYVTCKLSMHKFHKGFVFKGFTAIYIAGGNHEI